MACFLTQLFLKKITPRKVRFDTPRGYFFKKSILINSNIASVLSKIRLQIKTKVALT